MRATPRENDEPYPMVSSGRQGYFEILETGILIPSRRVFEFV